MIQRKPLFSTELTFLLCLMTAAAGSTIVFAWWGAASTVALGTQVSWLEAGIVAAVLSATAGAGWVISARRAISNRRAVLGVAVLDYLECHPESDTLRTKERRMALVSAPAMSMFHRADCPIVSSKTVRAESRSAHSRAGRRPCGICQP